MKIFRLLVDAVGKRGVGFRSIDEVEAENIFLPFSANVKAIAVVRFVAQLLTILQHLPKFTRGAWASEKKKGERENGRGR